VAALNKKEMEIIWKRFVFIGVLLLMTSCAIKPVDGGRYNLKTFPKPAGNESLVVFMQKGKHYYPDQYVGRGWKANIDDGFVGHLFEDYYTTALVDPGQHSVSVICPASAKPMHEWNLYGKKKLVLNVKSGRTYYVLLEANLKESINYVAFTNGAAYNDSVVFTEEINFKQLDEISGLEVIKDLHRISGTY